ncbi:CerR family C-terminal domain-containing protein [Pseudoxanthomonas sp.]|uniref:TetR/AcrR family transcriptional regulator n=1 Tax=Pseudoxanthomonas sp. TaxID=1871049 RepID=UPI00260D174A|nr:CerR family C-terminal domain-containing protein [Pseudoxanthomonas sp.]WDS34794.1 MAG: CerR family C-terminal domain-containing protein [Pseudoxanthomonas sp.]
MTKGARPLRSDGDATRSRILESAGRLIAASGYAETTSKAVAADAGVDLASINYHFGNRSGLYQAVLAEGHRGLVSLSELSRLADSGLSASEQLREVLDRIVGGIVEADGWHVRVIAREIASPSPHLDMLFAQEVMPKMARLVQVISQITGIPAGDPALMRCLLSVAAPCLMLMIGGHLPGPIQQVFQMPRAVLVGHLHAFAMAGLAEAGRQHALNASASP